MGGGKQQKGKEISEMDDTLRCKILHNMHFPSASSLGKVSIRLTSSKSQPSIRNVGVNILALLGSGKDSEILDGTCFGYKCSLNAKHCYNHSWVETFLPLSCRVAAWI